LNESKLKQIQKLLRLSKNNTSVEEAALAFKTAQKLMEKYRISEAMLDSTTEEQEEVIEKDVLYSSRGIRLAWWKRTLSQTLAKVNGCKTYASKNRKEKISMIMVVGEPSDASTVRYMYNHIANTIDRLTKEAATLRGSPGKTWCNSFRVGAVEAVCERLTEAHEEARKEAMDAVHGNSTALVRVANAIAKLDKKAVDANKWAQDNVGLQQQYTRRRIDEGGQAAGRRAGAKINISKGGKKLGKGTRGYLPS
jgi:hypothetical protein